MARSGPVRGTGPLSDTVVIFRFLTNRTHLSWAPRVRHSPSASDALFEGAPAAGLPAIEPRPQKQRVCISLRSARWQLEVSRVRTRWFRGSLVLRRHLSSRAGSLEATANPLSSFSFSFHFSPAHHPTPSTLFSPARISVCCIPIAIADPR